MLPNDRTQTRSVLKFSFHLLRFPKDCSFFMRSVQLRIRFAHEKSCFSFFFLIVEKTIL
ncbi:unnamed protein product, partial [Amoebophrya sp. A120]|eukprot:GSA120T00022404001.1